MYILKTTTGEEIKIDFDELPKVQGDLDSLVFFRRGAVLRRLIGVILEDQDAKKEIMKRPGEKEEDVQKRLREKKSEDLFPMIRKPTLKPGESPKQLS